MFAETAFGIYTPLATSTLSRARGFCTQNSAAFEMTNTMHRRSKCTARPNLTWNLRHSLAVKWKINRFMHLLPFEMDFIATKSTKCLKASDRFGFSNRLTERILKCESRSHIYVVASRYAAKPFVWEVDFTAFSSAGYTIHLWINIGKYESQLNDWLQRSPFQWTSKYPRL